MVVCKKSTDVIIVFEMMIIILDSSTVDYKIKYEKRFQRKITSMIVNKKETWMAIALSINQWEHFSKIELYQLDPSNVEFVEPHKIDNIKNNIKFIDFSVDDLSLVYKTVSGNVFYVDISNKTSIKPYLEAPKTEWM